MDKAISTTKPSSASLPLTAQLALGAAITSLLLLAALHILRADLDPTWHMVSQYATGKFGWVQTLVFLTLALSCLFLFAAVRTQVQTRGGKIGLGFLLAGAVGLIMAAMFNWEHPLHGPATLIGVPGLCTAALLIGLSLARNPAWASVRRLVLWLSPLPWLAFIVMLVTLFTTMPPSGEPGPGVLIGLPNRLLFLTWYAWIIVAAWQANRALNQET
jgi:hypothetical protein